MLNTCMLSRNILPSYRHLKRPQLFSCFAPRRNMSLVTDLPGKTVLITGASSGIGRHAAIEFAKHSAQIALVARRNDALEETKAMCLEAGGTKEADILTIVASLDDPEECKKSVRETIEKFSKLDVIVNSAGILASSTIENLTLEAYDELMNINVRSVFVITQEAVPHLKETKGNIVNISSVTGTRSFPGVLSYCVSKAALDQMTRCVALDLAPFGVRCNSVNPGVIRTECHRNSGMDEETYAKFLEHSKTTHALGRVGEPDEVSKAIVFLVSADFGFTASNNLSGFMTGVNLPVDGGRGTYESCVRAKSKELANKLFRRIQQTITKALNIAEKYKSKDR